MYNLRWECEPLTCLLEMKKLSVFSIDFKTLINVVARKYEMDYESSKAFYYLEFTF